jgi:predicted dehydrogenase
MVQKVISTTTTSHHRTLRVALLGCGAVAELYYAPALKELERAEQLQVRALFDPSHDRVAQLNKSFPSATPIADLAELSKRDIDFAIIASPPRYHAEQAIQVLKSGISVLCEKPMATTIAEGEAMIEAAATAQKVLAIGLFRRFFPATQAIRQLLSLHLLGEVKSFSFAEGGIFDWPVQSASYFRKRSAQGGVLLDIGVHVLDLVIWWFGQPVEVLYEDDAMGGIEANCRIILRFAQGFTGEVRLSRDWRLANRHVIQCARGWLSWNANEAENVQVGFYDTDFALGSQLHENKLTSTLPTLGQPACNFQQSFVNQLRNVMAVIQGTEELVVPGDQALQSLRLIEYCYRHRTLMPMPWLSQQEYSRAQQFSSQAS